MRDTAGKVLAVSAAAGERSKLRPCSIYLSCAWKVPYDGFSSENTLPVTITMSAVEISISNSV